MTMGTIPICLLLILIHCSFKIVHSKVAELCRVDLEEWKDQVPVFIKNNYIIPPRVQVLTFDHGENIEFACPGRNNSFVHQKGQQLLKVTCTSGKFAVDQKRMNFSSLLCTKKTPEADVISTNSKCAKGEGIWKNIVFRYNTKTLPLYRTCYNLERWEPLFAVHTVEGAYSQDVWRESFSEQGLNLTKKDKYASYFKKNKQMETGIAILGMNQAEKYWGDCYLSRGHFAANGDFNYRSTQAATFFYLNTGPQWQKFNVANWKRIENKVRSLVDHDPNLILQVFTGSHGILKLPDDRGVSQEIYLNEDKIPVPKYFWKVVYNNGTGAGVAFIALNNPFVTHRDDIDNFCSCVCRNIGAYTNDFDDFEKGLVICCEVDKVRKKIGRMADLPRIQELYIMK